MNLREVIRRVLKMILLFTVLFMTLKSTKLLSNKQILIIMCINISVYSFVDNLYPTLKIEDNSNTRNILPFQM